MSDTLTPSPTISRQPLDALRVSLMSSRVLLLAPISDDTEELAAQLAADDVDVITAPSPQAARVRLAGAPPTAVLVAADLERGTGYAALEELREAQVLSPDCPAIALSAKADPVSRLRAMQRGCVDFLALPLFYPELVAR